MISKSDIKFSHTNGIRNRCFFIILTIFFLSFEILSFDFSCGLYIIALFFLCLGGLLIDYIYTGTLNVFYGKYFFLLSFFLLHGIGFFTYQLRQYLGIGVFEHPDGLIRISLLYSIIAVIIFLLSYSFGKRFIRLKISFSKNIRLKKMFDNPQMKWYILLLVICLFTFLLWGLMGNIPVLIENYHQLARAEVGKNLGLFEAIIESLINLSFLYIIICLKNRIHSSFLWVFLIGIISLFLLNVDRGGMVGYLLSMWIIYFVCVKKATLKQFLIICSLIIALAGIMGAMRIKSMGDWIISGGIIASEASVEFDNYVEVFNMTKENTYLHGSTLIPILTLPIPRTILPDKDKYLTAGNYFKEFHNHTHIRVGERISYIGELYLNFGITGIILGMMLVGILLSIVDKNLDTTSVLSIYFYLQFIRTFAGFVNGDIATCVVGFFMNNLLILVALVLIKLLIYDKKHEKSLC